MTICDLPNPPPALHAHLHCNCRMRIVPLNHEILTNKIINILHIPLPPQLRERPRLPLQLNLQRIDVVPIHMRITQLYDELVRFRICDFGDHVCEEGVRGDVEGDAEAEVGGALVHEAG